MFKAQKKILQLSPSVLFRRESALVQDEISEKIRVIRFREVRREENEQLL